MVRGTTRDLFEPGLNEAAASLAASYGRSSRSRNDERAFEGGGRASTCRHGEVWCVAVAKLGDLATILFGLIGRHCCRQATRRRFAGVRAP